MSKKILTILAIVIIIILGGIGVYYLFNKTYNVCWPYCPGMTEQDRENIKKSVLKAKSNSRSLSSQEDWQIFHNEKYGYEYKTPGNYYSFNVETNEPAEQPEGYKNLGLEEYAKKIWQLNKDDKNSNITNKFISNLGAIKIDGRDAFSFNLRGNFVWPTGGEVVEKERTYIFTGNKKGTIFLISFSSDDDISQDILKSFKINEEWITPKVEAGEWELFNGLNGFSFEYPSNIFNEGEVKDNSVIFDSKRGNLGVRIIDKKLDPNNIEGMYGKVNNPEIVKVGDKTGYKYMWGDAGCFAAIVVAAMENRTFELSFGSCSDDLYYLAEDKELEGKILSTFKFVE